MSEPKPTYPDRRHDVRLWHGAWWVYMDGRPYRPAKDNERPLTHAEPIPIADTVKTVKRVAGMETDAP